MRLLASARAMSPASVASEERRQRPWRQTAQLRPSEERRVKAERVERGGGDKRRTWGVVNRSVETRHVRTSSDRQVSALCKGFR